LGKKIDQSGHPAATLKKLIENFKKYIIEKITRSSAMSNVERAESLFFRRGSNLKRIYRTGPCSGSFQLGIVLSIHFWSNFFQHNFSLAQECKSPYIQPNRNCQRFFFTTTALTTTVQEQGDQEPIPRLQFTTPAL
jgi:hypothetical protein